MSALQQDSPPQSVFVPSDFRRERRSPEGAMRSTSSNQSLSSMRRASQPSVDRAAAGSSTGVLATPKSRSSPPVVAGTEKASHNAARRASHSPVVESPPRLDVSRMSHDLSRQRSALQEEAARSWDSYQPRPVSSSTAISSGSSLTKAALAKPPTTALSRSASEPPSPTFRSPFEPSLPSLSLGDDGVLEHITPSRSSAVRYSMSTLSTASPHSPAQGVMDDDATQRLLAAAEAADSRSRSPVARIPQPPPSAPLPGTSNEKSAKERREQLRRAQKLVSLLGGEVLSEGEGHEIVRLRERDSNRPPLLVRRQSDPFEILAHAKLALDEQLAREQRHDGSPSASRQSKLALRRRSRGKTILAVPLDAPRNVGPKAAALLGLDASSPWQVSSAPTTPAGPVGAKAAALLGMDRVNLAHAQDKSNTEPRRSTSTFERSKAGSSGTRAASLGKGKADQVHVIGFESKPAALDVADSEPESPSVLGDDEERTAAVQREERRRRVAKISRWLGAVVPPHLVSSGEAPAAPAYGAGQAPHLEGSDYFSGQPASSERSHSGLGRAKAATLAKLRRPSVDQDATIDANFPRQSQSSVEALSPRERIANVRRANTLTKRFGEAPPQQLFAASGGSGSDTSTTAPLRRHRHTQSAALPLATQPDEAEERAPPQEAAQDARPSTDSQQFRQSIGSLEYLLDNDLSLLSELVQALDEGSEVSDDVHATPKARNPFESGWRRPSADDDAASTSQAADDSSLTYKTASSHAGSGVDGSSSPLPVSTPSESDDEFSEAPALELPPVGAVLPDASPRRASLGSLVTLASTTDSLSSASSAAHAGSDPESALHSAHRQQAARAQKLSKFFGEAVSLSTPTRAGTSSSQPPAALLSSPPQRPVQRFSGSPAPARLAPRSAGSARPSAAFQRLLRSLEDELEDDESLSAAERHELTLRIEQLRRRQADVDA